MNIHFLLEALFLLTYLMKKMMHDQVHIPQSNNQDLPLTNTHLPLFICFSGK